LFTEFSSFLDSDAILLQAEYQPYRLAFRRVWHSAHASHRQRCGFWIKLQTGQGLCAYGECAPFTEVGTETLAQAQSTLPALLAACKGRSIAEIAAQLHELSDTPALRCALETALLDICAQQQGLSVARWLSADALQQVAVNAACGALDEGFAARLQQALSQGYSVIKIKLGLYPLEEELSRLQQLQLPAGMRLRLDANQACSLAQAQQLIEVCNRLNIESLEEPLCKPDLAKLRLLQQQAQFPLALDESLQQNFATTPMAELPVKRQVLKCTAVGGPLPVLQRAQLARQAGIETVLTSTLETPVGLRAALQVSAALGSHLAQGLATADLFEHPPADLCPQQGMLNINQQAVSHLPGFGWRTDEDD